MKKENTYRVIFWVVFLFVSVLINKNSFATHAQSADITYQCLGPNQYEISVSFYRDCAGVNAPNTITINTTSASCAQNFNTTLSQIPGTGVDVTPICATLTTQCNGGNTPGVEEYIYRGIINLPNQCNDWTFSFTLCCRNNAINTINNPGGENIYVEAVLNNLDVTCNNSPSFSNPPVYFPCVGQTSCFNHGAIEPDGDSLYYSLIAPGTGPATTVTYLAGYSALQPLTSNIPTTFNSSNGDICMTPTLQEVTVLAVKVEEWRNGVFIGSVTRDIQLRSVVCNNTLPNLSGINGTGQFSLTGCAGSPINFNIPSFDPDLGQTLTINWNNAIPAANFTTNGAQQPTANFNWTPTAGDVSATPYCFTVSISDDNCSYNGVQIYSFCITVTGFTTSTTSTSANCNASNGTATATVQGGLAPYTYQWLPNGGNNANANGLTPGQYTVNVTDANGCISSSIVNVGTGPLPGNINISSTNISCFGGNDGSATANVNGGGQPYVYSWSNGGFNQTISNLTAGTYFVTVISNGGCVTTDTITITAPSSPVTAVTTQTNVTCFGSNDGSSTVIPTGGVGLYTVVWNTTPIQNNLTATGLANGSYTVTITDNNGCVTTQNISITQPLPLNFSVSNQQDVNCFGGNDGLISININGGTGPYSYNWNNNTYPDSNTINNLTVGIYLLSITDANGCIANTQYTITEPTVLNTSVINSTNITCNGLNDGTIQTNTIGGTPPYSYQWVPTGSTSPNASNLSFGYHVLAVIDNNGCIDTTAVNITEPAAIVTVLQGDDTICPGQNSTLTATAFGGTGNFTYQWNNG
ncbi:MAG: SprB repeat-containing protein, partial [Flavobacteriales bacterium]|nr:SprB repeat-containing protein [Flavobacteriales bacterium]